MSFSSRTASSSLSFSQSSSRPGLSPSVPAKAASCPVHSVRARYSCAQLSSSGKRSRRSQVNSSGISLRSGILFRSMSASVKLV